MRLLPGIVYCFLGVEKQLKGFELVYSIHRHFLANRAGEFVSDDASWWRE